MRSRLGHRSERPDQTHWANDFEPVGLDTGEPRVILTAVDITERKESEEELRRAHAELALLEERIEAEDISLREAGAARHLHGDRGCSVRISSSACRSSLSTFRPCARGPPTFHC